MITCLPYKSNTASIVQQLLAIMIVVGMVALPQQATKAQSRVGTTAATFLTLGTGAKASALGHAYTATATGADALFWNPAGSAIHEEGTSGGQVFLNHYEWFAGINYNAGSATVPVGDNTFGFSIAHVDYGRIEITRVGQENGTGIDFESSDISIGLSYARPLTDTFIFGLTGKFVRQKIWDSSASTGAIDAGFLLLTDFWNGIRIAGSINNFGGKMQMTGINNRVFTDIAPDVEESNDQIPANIDTDEFNLPIQVRAGLVAPLYVRENVRFEAMVDAQQTNDNNINADIGGEFRFSTNATDFNLRAGYKDAGLDNSYSHFSYGLGIDVNLVKYIIGFNFAVTSFDDLGDVHMIDVKFSY